MSEVEKHGEAEGTVEVGGPAPSLLSQVETSRWRVALHSALPLLAVLLAGGVLFFFVARRLDAQITERRETIVALDRQIAEAKAKLAESEAKRGELAGTYDEALKKALEAIPSVDTRREVVRGLESSPVVNTTPKRIFIHIHDEEQRGKAREVEQALKAAGFIVPGIERRPETVDGNQVKFFRQEDGEAANQAASVTAANGVPDVKAVPLTGYKAPPGQLEVWFAPASEVAVAVLRNSASTLEEALLQARSLAKRALPFTVEIHRHRDGKSFHVTLGGYTSNEEAEERVRYAKQHGLALLPYASTNSVGENLNQ